MNDFISNDWTNKLRILNKKEDLIKNTGDLVIEGINNKEKVTVIFPHKRPSHFVYKYIADYYKNNNIKFSTDLVSIFSIDDFIDYIWDANPHSAFPPYPKIEPQEASFLLFDLNKNKETALIDNAEKLDIFISWGYKLFADFEEILIESADPSSCNEIIKDNIMIHSMNSGLKNNNADSYIKFSDRFSNFSNMFNSFYKKIVEKKFTSRSYRYKTIADFLNSKENETYKILSPFTEGKLIIAGFYGITKAESAVFKNLLDLNKNSLVVSKKGVMTFDFLEKICLKNGSGLSAANGGYAKYKELKKEYKEESEIKGVKFNFNKVSSVHNEIACLKETLKALNPSNSSSFSNTADPSNTAMLSNASKDGSDSGNLLTSKDLIVLSDEDYLFPLMHNVLGSLESEYNVSIGYSLNRTPIYTVLNLLSILHGRKKGDKFYAKDYISLFLHPYVKNISGRIKNISDQKFSSTEARMLFHSIETYVKKNKILFVSIKNLETSELFKNLDDSLKLYISEMHRVFIHNFNNISDIKDFIGKITEIIDLISNNSNAGKHPYGAKFLESAIKVLMEFDADTFGSYEFEGISGYFSFLKNIFKHQKIPFKGTPIKGLQILGPLETRLINFDRIFYLGANEGILPNISKENTFLTEEVRRYLGLNDAGKSSKIQEYNFFNLISPAKEVHFFYNDSNKSEKSRFVEKIIWDIQKKSKNLETPTVKNQVFKINFNDKELSSVSKSAEIKKYLLNETYSASMLDTYLKCRLKFYYNYVLRLKEEKEITDDIDAAGIGTIIHAVLNKYFKYFSDKPDKLYSIENIETEKNTIKKILDETFPDYGSNAIKLQKKQILIAINMFLERRQTDLYGAKILGTEEKLESALQVDHNLNASIAISGISSPAEIKLSGRSDLIAEKGGEYFIIDFKTGSDLEVPRKDFKPSSLNRQEWLKNIKSVQLPFYILLYSKMSKNNPPQIEYSKISAKLWGIKKNEEKYFDLKKDERYGDASSYYEGFFKMLLEEIINFDIFESVKNESERTKVCPNCAYSVLCGRLK